MCPPHHDVFSFLLLVLLWRLLFLIFALVLLRFFCFLLFSPQAAGLPWCSNPGQQLLPKQQAVKRKGEVGKTGAAGMCRQPAKRSYYGIKGWSWENWSCRNVQATSKKKLLWNEQKQVKWKGEVGKTGAVGMCRQPAKRSYYGMKGWSWEHWSCRNVQTTSTNKLNERVKLGTLELQECADNQQKQVKWKGEVGNTGAAGMCRQPAKRSYFGMKGWSWENWSCRNVQATSKKKLLWNERVKLGKLELQECADNQQKEVIME